jgi:hypothetical protein
MAQMAAACGGNQESLQIAPTTSRPTTTVAPTTTTTTAIPGNPGDSKNCSDFNTQRAAQNWFNTYFPYYGAVARLDGDNDRGRLREPALIT